MQRTIIYLFTHLCFFTYSFAQWNKVEDITTPLIYSALFDGNNIFVGGDSLYISNDKGKSWKAIAPAGQKIEIMAFLKSGNYIFLGTYGMGIYLSSDDGKSWSPNNIGLSDYALYAKKFSISGDTVFYGTDGGGVYFLKLGSNNWQSYNENLFSNIAWTVNDIAVTNTNLILSSGASGFYYLRPKGSPQWSEARIQTPNGSYTTPNAFLVIENIVFAGTRVGIYRSMDNGISWDSVGIRALPLNAICFTNNANRIYAGFTRSTDYFVWYSDDLGDTWNSYDHQFQYLHKLYIYDDKIWAATNDGLWYKSLETTSIKPIELANEFKLEQNYPNQFNPTTTIEYVLPEKSNAKLIVFNSIGEEIAVLVNEEQDRGFHSVEFKAINLPSGVYFYQLRTGNFVDTKKMVLTK